MTDYTPDPHTLRALLDAPKIAAECPPDLDSYTWAASKVCGVEYGAVTPDQRAVIKLACFGSSPTGRLPSPHREVVSDPLTSFADRLRSRLGFIQGRRFDSSLLDQIAEALRDPIAEVLGQIGSPDERDVDLRVDVGPDHSVHVSTFIEHPTGLPTLRASLSWEGVKAYPYIEDSQLVEVPDTFDFAALEKQIAERFRVPIGVMQGDLGPGPFSEIDHWYQHVEQFHRAARRVTVARFGTRAPKRKRPRRIARKLAQRQGFAKYPTASQASLRKWCRP